MGFQDFDTLGLQVIAVLKWFDSPELNFLKWSMWMTLTND
jgi:hypothetical protein